MKKAWRKTISLITAWIMICSALSSVSAQEAGGEAATTLPIPTKTAVSEVLDIGKSGISDGRTEQEAVPLTPASAEDEAMLQNASDDKDIQPLESPVPEAISLEQDTIPVLDSEETALPQQMELLEAAPSPGEGRTEEQVLQDFVDTTDITGISDEDFYGVYDQEQGVWIKESYFDYENHPEFDAVKNAVMEADGDYTQVKEEVLSYYRNKRDGYNYDKLYGSTGADSVFFGYAMQNNFYYHPTWKALGNAFVDDTSQYISFDVTRQWDEIKNSSDKCVSMMLIAYRKDGDMAEFESREGEHPPILEIESNGAVTTLEASEDATVIAGEHAQTNYGHEPNLLVEESVETIGKTQMTDSNTKRAHVKFDLSQISTESTVTRVTFKVYGRNADSANQKEIFAFQVPINSWKEDKVTFEKPNKDEGGAYEHMAFSWDGEDYINFYNCKQQYCGYRYNEELSRFETWFPLLGGMFVQGTTNQEDYALTLLRQWAGWLTTTGKNPKGGSYYIPLDLGCRTIEVPKAMTWLITSEHMTAELYSATLKYFWHSMQLIVDENYAIDDPNNAGVVAGRGLHALNCYFNEFRMYPRALEKVKWKVSSICEGNLVQPDGSYTEGSLLYAGMTVSNLKNFSEANTITGNPDVPFTDEQFDILRKLTLYLIQASMPGGKESQWGDGGAYDSADYRSNAKIVQPFFDDPVIDYFATNGEKGSLPDFTSHIYNSTKRVVMRTGWGEDDIYLFSDMDGATSFHSHNDDNAIILGAYGEYLLSDQLFYSYNTGPVKTYLLSPRAHNTVEIDDIETTVTKKKGEIQYWETNGIYDNSSNTTFQYQRSNLNEKHTRNILFIRPGFFIVSDYIKPYDTDTSVHNYKQHWHMPPDAQISMDEDSMKIRSNMQGKANIQVVPVGTESIDHASIEEGYYISTTNQYARLEKETAGPAIFDTILYPEQPGETAQITAQSIPLTDVTNNGATALEFEIESPGVNRQSTAAYYLVHDPAQQTVRQFGSYETDARCAYIEKDNAGNLTTIIVQDGTYVKDLTEDKIIYQSNVQVPQCGIKFEYGIVEIESSQGIDLTQMTVYAKTANEIKNLRYNGENTAFKKSGKYLYFGEEPIITEPDNTPTPKPTARPGSGGGGGGGGMNPPGSNGSAIGSVDVSPSLPVTNPSPSPSPVGKPSDAYQDELESFWGKNEITELVDAGIMKGLDSQTLALEQDITRAEFLTLLCRALGWEERAYQKGQFTDVSENDWYADTVQAAYEKGLISGNGEKAFLPQNKITREEMAKILSEAYKETARENGLTLPQVQKASYADQGQISSWAQQYVDEAGSFGLMLGDEKQCFRPQAYATRGEAGVVIYRLMEKLEA